MAQYGQGALPPPEPDPPKSGDEHHSKKKDKKVGQLMVGDPVHFAVQDGAGKGPTRHGSVVLFVDGERALLASSPGVPNVKVIEVGGDKVGMSWVKTAYLGRGHKHCQTSLTLSLDAAWGLRSKILLTAGEVNEQIVLSGRGSATASNASDGSATSGAQSPWPQDEYGEQARPQDRELRAMVQEAMSSLQHQPPQHSNNPPPSGQMDQQQQHHHQHEQQQQYPHEQQQQAMPPRQHVNHDYSGFSGDPNMARDLQNLIAQSFDEGIQAFRDEQKNMDRWVGLLQERVNKVTGHFLMSWGSRLESEMDRRLTKYSEEIKTTCASLQALQPVGYVGPPAAPKSLGKVAETAPTSNSGIVVRENSRDRNSGKKQQEKSATKSSSNVASEKPVTKTSSNVSGSGSMMSAQSTSHEFGFQRRNTKNDHTLVMIEKIKRDQARSSFFRQAIEHSCACYHQDCIPKPFVAFVNSSIFNNFCAIVTLLFAVTVGIEVNAGMVSALRDEDPAAWIGTVVNIFNLWFAIEVVLRFVAGGIEYLVGEEWRWNVFDMFLVVLSIFDMVSDTGAVGFMRLVRAFKIMKALRVVRVLRLFHELRLMVAQMLMSLGSLFWSMVFLAVVIYLAAIAFMQAGVSYIKDTSSTNEIAEAIKLNYQNLPDSMYTLLCSITGGIDWKDAAMPVWHFGWAYGMGFMGFVLVCILGILNIVTSVFVERASNMKRLDRDFAISEELRIMESDIQETMELFQTFDPDENNCLKQEDFHRFLKEEHVMAHFATIGIDVSDPAKFEHLLSPSDAAAGLVSINAFVTGCVSLRGAAKQSDTLSIVLAVQKLEQALHVMKSDVSESVKQMTGFVESRGGGSPRSDGVGTGSPVPQEEGAMNMPANRAGSPYEDRADSRNSGLSAYGMSAIRAGVGSTEV